MLGSYRVYCCLQGRHSCDEQGTSDVQVLSLDRHCFFEGQAPVLVFHDLVPVVPSCCPEEVHSASFEVA